MEDYKEETIKSYDINTKHFSRKFKDLFDLSRRPEFQKFVELISNKDILDLGCGSGDHSLYFKELGLNVTCIDLSKEMIKLCKEKGLNAQIMDIENLRFNNNSFDGIWAVTSLLHIPKKNMKNVINNLYKILKKDGVLYVSVKEGEGEKFIIENNTKRFFSFWTKDELLKEFKDYFELIKFGRKKLNDNIFLEFFLKKI